MVEHKFYWKSESQFKYVLFVDPLLTGIEENKQELVEKKWNTIVDFLRTHKWVTRREISGGGSATCAFCVAHIRRYCMECPIRKRTGIHGCELTPYTAWSFSSSWSECLSAAIAEAEFVRSLRVEKK